MTERIGLRIGLNKFYGEVCESPAGFLPVQNGGEHEVLFLAIKLDEPANFPDGHKTHIEVFYEGNWTLAIVEAPPRDPSHKIVFLTIKLQQ